MVFDNAATRPAKPARDVDRPRACPRALHVGPELSLEDLVMDVRPEAPPAATAPTIKRAVSPRAATSRRSTARSPEADPPFPHLDPRHRRRGRPHDRAPGPGRHDRAERPAARAPPSGGGPRPGA